MITIAQIEQLEIEAGEHGDYELAEACRRILEGDERPGDRALIERTIRYAAAEAAADAKTD